MSAAALAPPGGVAYPLMRSGFAPEHVAQLGAGFTKIGMSADVAAQTPAGNGGIDNGAKPPGGSIEDEDAVRKDEHLVDAVGEEDDSRDGARRQQPEIL